MLIIANIPFSQKSVVCIKTNQSILIHFFSSNFSYTFYDGPPFATGLPHYGHILTGTIKDVVTRFAHQQGYHVERRFVWDCHGLPVEYEIDKTLNIRGPEDVTKMGIAAYKWMPENCHALCQRMGADCESNGSMDRYVALKYE